MNGRPVVAAVERKAAGDASNEGVRTVSRRGVSNRVVRGNEMVVERVDDRRRVVPEVELGEDPSDVALDGDLGDGQLTCDLLVRAAPREQSQHLELAGGQLLGWDGLWLEGQRRAVGM